MTGLKFLVAGAVLCSLALVLLAGLGPWTLLLTAIGLGLSGYGLYRYMKDRP